MHFKISMIKSAIRIIGCLISLFIKVDIAILILAGSLLAAELIGILEEVYEGK